MVKKWTNVAIVGCGKIYNDGHRGGYSSKFASNCVIVGFCDLRENLAKEQMNWMKKEYEKRLEKAVKKKEADEIERLKFGLARMKVYTSYEKMLDELKGSLDLVDNCTPGMGHIPLSVQAMEAGYHAMAEKPPGINWWDVKRAVRAEQKTGKIFQLNENVCYERPVQKMRQILMEGHLGKIKEVTIQFGHGGPYIPYMFGATGLPHFIDPLMSGGGCLQDLAPHGISRAFWAIGPEGKVVSCETRKLERWKHPREMSGKPFESKVDDWAEASLEMYDARTKSNYTMDVTTSWCGSFPFPCDIEGENGHLVTQKHLLAYEPCIIGNDDKEKYFSIDKDDWEPHESHFREIQILSQRICEGKTTDTPAIYALHLQEILSIQFLSKLLKKRVTLEEMEQWGHEIAGKFSDEQKGINEIAIKLTSAVDQLN